MKRFELFVTEEETEFPETIDFDCSLYSDQFPTTLEYLIMEASTAGEVDTGKETTHSVEQSVQMLGNLNDKE